MREPMLMKKKSSTAPTNSKYEEGTDSRLFISYKKK